MFEMMGDTNVSNKPSPFASEDQLTFLFADDSGAGSEEGGGSANPAPPWRCGSKRARAAEVHNLSEKRRRSRINEKMKALQELIPNSTKKTDKATMLDEAIEYLKQLQLQVQTLSARNGLSTTHPMYLSEILQPLHASNFPSSYGGNTLSVNAGVLGMLPLSNGPSSFSQSVLLPTTNISAIDQPSQAHDRSFQEIFREGMGLQQQVLEGNKREPV